jgi:hypothetical protein
MPRKLLYRQPGGRSVTNSAGSQCDNGAAPGRAFDVVLKARTLRLLAQLTQEQIPINGDREWVAQAAEEHGLSTFDYQLVVGATEYDWLLAEVLDRLANGDIAGLSLIDFVPPGTVLALWHALPAPERRYLRAVFQTVAGPEPREADRLALLDRLVAGAAEEISAAATLLQLLTATDSAVDAALQELAGGDGENQLPAAVAVQARTEVQDLLAAVATGADPTAWMDQHHPPRPLPPRPEDTP